MTLLPPFLILARDWRYRIALLRTKLRLREASAKGLMGLVDCAAEVEETSVSSQRFLSFAIPPDLR